MTVLAERTTLAEPAVIAAVATRPAEPASPAVPHPGQPATPGRPAGRSGRGRSANAGAGALATTEQLLRLRMTVDDLLAAVAAAQAYHLASLHAPRIGADGADLVDLIGGVDPRYADVDDHLSLRPLFAALPPRERRILTLRFYGDMNQTQIAAEIGLSQMHVSRLLRQSLARLRAAMPD
jgi:hypothetical protein